MCGCLPGHSQVIVRHGAGFGLTIGVGFGLGLNVHLQTGWGTQRRGLPWGDPLSLPGAAQLPTRADGRSGVGGEGLGVGDGRPGAGQVRVLAWQADVLTRHRGCRGQKGSRAGAEESLLVGLAVAVGGCRRLVRGEGTRGRLWGRGGGRITANRRQHLGRTCEEEDSCQVYSPCASIIYMHAYVHTCVWEILWFTNADNPLHWIFSNNII